MRRTSITPTPPFFVLTLGVVWRVEVDSFSTPLPALFLRSADDDIFTKCVFVIRLRGMLV